jgi:hypothetical protein
MPTCMRVADALSLSLEACGHTRISMAGEVVSQFVVYDTSVLNAEVQPCIFNIG